MPEMEENNKKLNIQPDEIKDRLAESFKNHKRTWIAGIVVAAIIIVAIIIGAFVNSDTGRAYVISAVLPSSVEVEAGDQKITFYQIKNKGFKDGDGAYAIDVYYIDENGEKVMLDNCRYNYTYEGEEQSIDVYLSFILTAIPKVDTVKAVVKGVIWLVVVVAVVVAIVIWYRYDKKTYEKEKEKRNRNRNTKKNKK